jgi:ABC-type transport system involved in multi-copper enzyme maturation permease subunit
MGLLRAELLKLARYAAFWWMAAALLILALLRGLVWPPDPALPWPGLWSITLITTALVALTAVSTGMEFAEDTLSSFISRGVPRWALLLSKFITLVLAGGVLLIAIEGLVTVLGVRPGLRWGELGRAWLSLWPYISLIMLLAVLARNGGLALVVGILWIWLEQAVAGVMAPFAMLPEVQGLRFFTGEGALGQLMPWTLSYNSANWTYLSDATRAPMPMNILLLASPRSALHSLLVLVVYAAVGLSLCLLLLAFREELGRAEGRKGLFGGLRRRSGRQPASTPARQAKSLPRIGRAPVLVRLVVAHLFKMSRTRLVRIGLVVSLLFPLAVWGVSKALEATGFEDIMFGAGPGGGSPLAIVISLLLIGPLATVIAALDVSNELSLGTRRAELARGVTVEETILAQSVALILIIGLLYTVVMAVILLLTLARGSVMRPDRALVAGLVAMLSAGTYIGVVQCGAALSRSPLGPMVLGLGFLALDWFVILLPTVMMDEGRLLLTLGRLAPSANSLVLANGGEILRAGIQWPHLSIPAAVWLLIGLAAGSHALAVLIARRRDA